MKETRQGQRTVPEQFTLLTACSVYSKYQQATEVEADLYGKEYSSEDTTSIATLSWKELFRDTCLQRLIDTALVRNTDLGIARLRVKQAEAALLTARLSYLPSAKFGAESGFSSWDGSTSLTCNISGEASWELDIFGKLTAAKREARASLEKSYAYMQAVQTSLVATVASTYYTLLMLDEQIVVAEQTLQSWERTAYVLRSLMRAGKANDAAVLQAEANGARLPFRLFLIPCP
ncbi:MAG: TolC family protein [Candidatus Cryptobacteroides sp.]